jgi:DHA1 family inner membrane transport protein
MNKEKLLLLTLTALNFTHIMDFMIMMPLGSYLMPLFKLSPSQFSMIVSSYTFSAGISGFFAAFFVDNFDRKKILLIGYTGFILSTFVCGLSSSYSMLLISRIIAGAFGGLISAQVLSIIADKIPFERRASAMGTLMAGFSLASVAGVPFGLFLASVSGWGSPFIFIGCLGIVVIILVNYFIPKMNGHIDLEKSTKKSLSVITNILEDRNQLRGLLLTAAMMLGHFSIIPFIAAYMEFNVGFNKIEITYIYLFGGIASLISSPLIGRLADKIGKLKTFSIFIVGSSVPVLFITNMPQVHFYYALIATTLFFVFAGGRFIPAQAMISAVVKPERRGGFMSINSSMQQLASGIASLMAGAIIAKGASGELLNYRYVGFIGIAVSLSCIFIAQKLKPVE